MINQLAIGAGAGLAAALLYSSVGFGGPAAILLFYIATLPLFIAGLGWGWATAGIAALTGALATLFALGGLAALVFLAGTGAPAAWLSYLANLSRETTGPKGPALEWYPVGRLVAWAAGIGGALMLVSVMAFGLTLESYEASIRGILTRMVGERGTGALPGDIDIDAVTAFFMRYVPSVSVVVWTGATLASLYLAARAVQVSGRLPRPWPDIGAFDLPREMMPALALALAASFVPGIAGLIAGAVGAGLVFAYMLLGLAVVHAASRPSAMRPMLLGAVYFALVFIGWSAAVLNWVGLLLAILGLGEAAFGLRARFATGRGGPPAPRDNGFSD